MGADPKSLKDLICEWLCKFLWIFKQMRPSIKSTLQYDIYCFVTRCHNFSLPTSYNTVIDSLHKNAMFILAQVNFGQLLVTLCPPEPPNLPGNWDKFCPDFSSWDDILRFLMGQNACPTLVFLFIVHKVFTHFSGNEWMNVFFFQQF